MRWIRRAFWTVCALALVLLVLLAAYGWRSQAQIEGERTLPGLRAPVSVQRDASDVAHILASDARDAWFTLGFVHAQERGWQMEFNRRVMRGRLSELFGEATLNTDRLMRTLGLHGAARAQLAGLDDESRTALQAYSDGVNAFHAHRSEALSPEFQVFRVDPREEAAQGRYWEPTDSVAWSLMMALDLGGNWGNELARLSALQVLDTPSLWTLMPPYPGEPPAASADLAGLYHGLGLYRPEADAKTTSHNETGAGGPGERWRSLLAQDIRDWTRELGNVEGKGSNNWVVGPERSSSGQPLLANDPHLGLSAPAIWYFARLQAPDVPGLAGLDVMGATLPGTPFIVLGRTRGVAWGFTNTGPDVQDLYLEQLAPGQPGRYRIPAADGLAWADFQTREETIRVKGQPDVTHTVRTSRHGPVISDVPGLAQRLIDTSKYALALRWTALDADNRNVRATLRSNRAQTVGELLEAYREFHAPMQNVLAADTQGRIAYKAVGKVPVRSPDNDIRGVAPAPGWEERYDWVGWIAHDDTPQDNGARGWIATANQRIHPADYPHFLTQDWAAPYRQSRIEQLLQQTPQHDLNSFTAMHADLYSAATLRLLPHVLRIESDHPLAASALATLQGFDGMMDAGRAAPLIYTAWIDEFTRAVVGQRLGAERFGALYGKRTFRQGVEGILERDDAAWCGAGGCAQASRAALERALDRLQAEQGSDVSRWRWGQAHPAISVHRPFSNVAALAPLFEVRVPTGGDPFTLNVGQYHLDKADAPYANRHAASLRAIYDLGDLERSVFIYQTGQSGNVFSPRYRDMSEDWAAVRYRALRMDPPDWVARLQLKP